MSQYVAAVQGLVGPTDCTAWYEMQRKFLINNTLVNSMISCLSVLRYLGFVCVFFVVLDLTFLVRRVGFYNSGVGYYADLQGQAMCKVRM